MMKKCIFQLSECVTFKQSQNWKNFDTLSSKILVDMTITKFKGNVLKFDTEKEHGQNMVKRAIFGKI